MSFALISPIKPVETATASSNPWIISNTPSFEDTVLQDGVYSASIAGFLDLGIQSTEFGIKTQYSAFFAVYKELSEDTEIVTLWKNFTPSTNDKSAMYKIIMAANNNQFDNDISKLVGKPIQLVVTTYSNAQGKMCNKIDNFLAPKYNVPAKEADVPKFLVADIKNSIGNLNIPTLTEEEHAKYMANKKEPKASAPVLQRRSFTDRPVAESPKRVSRLAENSLASLATPTKQAEPITETAIAEFLQG